MGFARQGARVVVASTTMANNRAVAEAIHQEGGEALPIQVDVADPRAVHQAVEETLRAFGTIDVLINNASLRGESIPAGKGHIGDMPTALWRRFIAVNLTGPFLCSQACLKTMIPRRSGSIINLASYAPVRPRAGLGAYAASKAGLIALTKVLAVEVQEHHIAVNAILPGFTATGARAEAALPSGLRPDTSLPLVLFLASQEPIQVTGELIDAVDWNERNGFGGRDQWVVE